MNKYLKILSLIFLVASNWTFADTSELKCTDAMGGLEIISRMAPNKYEADYWSWGVPRSRVVLITEHTEFSNAGNVYKHFWVDANQKPEFLETTTNNGFSKKVRVIRESLACGELERPKMEAAEKAEQEEKAKQRALTDKNYREWKLQMQAERDKESKMTPAQKKAQDKADKEESKRVSKMQAEQTEARQDALRKQGDESNRKMTTWFSLPQDKRQDICLKMFKGDAGDCSNGRWVPEGDGLDQVFP